MRGRERTGRGARGVGGAQPDAAALPAAEHCDPAERAILRESIRLAFVAALQYLPPRQRAVLLLTQVLNWSAAEAAASLGVSVAAVNGRVRGVPRAGETDFDP